MFRKRVFHHVVVFALLLAVALLLFWSPTSATHSLGKADGYILEEVYSKLPLSFEINQGQVDNEVEFLARSDNYTLFLKPTEVVLALSQIPARFSDLHFTGVVPTPPVAEGAEIVVYRMELLEVLGNEASARTISEPRVTGLDELPARSNYFVGNSQHWHTGVPHYAGVQYHNVYPGVDLVFSGTQQELEFEFVLSAGADPGALRLGFDNIRQLNVDAQGDLRVRYPDGAEFILDAPAIYQDSENTQQVVSGSYVKKSSRTVGFQVRSYDAERPLFVRFSAHLGSKSSYVSNNISLDADGNVYLVGDTCLTDLPTYSYQATCRGSANNYGVVDVFVTKISPASQTLAYTTYFGGISLDSGRGIAVDNRGNAYITGETASKDFPLGVEGTPRYNRTLQSGDVFVTKLDPLGGLVYSSRLEGEDSRGIGVDTDGNAYVMSSQVPGTNRTVIRKLDPTGSGVLYSTLLDFVGRDVVVDASGIAYVTGSQCSGDLTTCAAPVLGLNPEGGSAYFSRGFVLEGIGTGITLGPGGEIYVVGETRSCQFFTDAAIQDRCGRYDEDAPGAKEEGDNSSDAFVVKLDVLTERIIYSTYLGGDGDDFGNDITLDTEGNAYVTGITRNPLTRATPPKDLPTEKPWQGENAGVFDIFVAKLDPEGSTLDYSTFLGGKDDDVSNAIAVDAIGNIYLTGFSESADFPIEGPSGVAGSFLARLAPSSDLGVTRSALSTTVMADSVLSYDLTITNNGPSDAIGVILSETLPAGLAVESSTPDQGSCATVNDGVECHLGDLLAGTSATVAIQINIGSSTAGTFPITASVTAAQFDPQQSNNIISQALSVTVPAAPGLPETPVPAPSPTPEKETVLLSPEATPVLPGETAIPTQPPPPTPAATEQPMATPLSARPTEPPGMAEAVPTAQPPATPVSQPPITPAPTGGGGCAVQAGKVTTADGGWLLLGLVLIGLLLARRRNRQ